MATERIPQSVAIRVMLKAFLSSDHVSPATGKTLAVVISKNGGAFANPSAGATNATEIANGWYYVDLSATDTGTLGPLVVRATAATVDDVEPPPLRVVDAHNAGFDAVPSIAFGATGGLATGVVRGGTAQSATASTVVLDAGASAVDNFYAGDFVYIASGTGAGQVRQIISYTGSSKSAVVYSAGPPAQGSQWATNPDNTSVFQIVPYAIMAAAVNITGGAVYAIVDGASSNGQVAVADGILTRVDGVEAGYNLQAAMRLISAVAAGLSTNGNKTFRDLNNTKDRIVATLDGSGNRTAITRDPT